MSNTENGNLKPNGNGKFKGTIDALVGGMENFLSTKSVVGEPIHIGDTIILPLVDVSFGVGAGAFNKETNSAGGGMGAKMSPTAVLVIANGSTRLISVKNSTGIDKLLDMVPDFVDKFKSFAFDKTEKANRSEAEKAMEETIVEASKVNEES